MNTLVSISAIILGLQITKGLAFSMLSKNQHYVLQTGDQIQLDCEFLMTHFNLFDNPVVWSKRQNQEQSTINILGNINDPFNKTGRFKIKFEPSEPRYQMILQIKDVSIVDTGNYTCQVRGPETSTLGTITHSITIREPVQDLLLNKDNCSSKSCASSTPPTLAFTENVSSPLQCVATGGNPVPIVHMYMDQRDITRQFRMDTYNQLLGVHGLRIIHSSVHARTPYMIVNRGDHGKEFRCTASVRGQVKNVTSSKIHVNFPPTIDCQEKVAYLRQQQVNISCRVTSRPKATNLSYVIDDSGTTVKEGSMKDNYWVLLEDKDQTEDSVTVLLFMRSVQQSSFRTYTVSAENVVGHAKGDATLKQRFGLPQNDEDTTNDLTDYYDSSYTNTKITYLPISRSEAHNHVTVWTLIVIASTCASVFV